MTRLLTRLLLPTLLSFAVAGCDQLGIESASDLAARREADGKAVGGACRHAGRAIEDCFALNKRSERAAILAGWREMNDYMAERQLAPLAPAGSTPLAEAAAPEVPASAAPAVAAPHRPGAHADG